jgi:hypothetical protein
MLGPWEEERKDERGGERKREEKRIKRKGEEGRCTEMGRKDVRGGGRMRGRATKRCEEIQRERKWEEVRGRDRKKKEEREWTKVEEGLLEYKILDWGGRERKSGKKKRQKE